MENFKTKMLGFMLTMVNVLLVVSVIAFVLSGAITIFYTEFNTLMADMGWTQERFAWMTVSTGALGSLGLVSTRLTGTLRSALLLAKTDNNNQIAAVEKVNISKFETQQKINEQLRNQMQLNNDANMKEMRAMRSSIDKQNAFNDLQAQKYVNAPDALVDPTLKAEYQKFLNDKSKEV